MKERERNGQVGLVLLLIAMIGFAVYQVVIAPMLVKEEKPSNSNVQTETEEERIARISDALYQIYSLTVEEEGILSLQDKALLEGTLSLYKMSNPVKIYLGFKNLEEKYFTSDGGYRLKDAIANANGRYYYEGTYIMKDALMNSIRELFGEIPIVHQTITLDNVQYVYDESKERYEVWTVRSKKESPLEKITYKEVVNNNNELYIYEYVAYTDLSDPANMKTSTVHNANIGVIITKDNVQDYLSYMDKYRYVFQRQEDGNYFFKSIEYVEE